MLPQAKHYSDSGYFFLSRPGYAVFRLLQKVRFWKLFGSIIGYVNSFKP
jgi:hypothetical protein